MQEVRGQLHASLQIFLRLTLALPLLHLLTLTSRLTLMPAAICQAIEDLCACDAASKGQRTPRCEQVIAFLTEAKTVCC